MKTRNIYPVILGFILFDPGLKAQGIDEVKELIDNERYETAESLLEKNTEGSNNPEVNYLLVKIYLEQDKTSEVRTFVNNRLTGAASPDAEPLDRVAYARYLLSTGNRIKAT
ncbi:MAG: hypothetical protein ABI688_03995, partial [Bacteroidota bacterium]